MQKPDSLPHTNCIVTINFRQDIYIHSIITSALLFNISSKILKPTFFFGPTAVAPGRKKKVPVFPVI